MLDKTAPLSPMFGVDALQVKRCTVILVKFICVSEFLLRNNNCIYIDYVYVVKWSMT